MRKALKSIASVVAAFLMVAVYALPAQAQLLQSAKVTLSDQRPNQSVTYTLTAKFPQARTTQLKGIKVSNRRNASTDESNPTADWSSADISAASWTVLTATDWSLDKTQAAAGNLFFTSGTARSVAQNDTVVLTIPGLNTPQIDAGTGCTPNTTNASTGTCYIRLGFYSTDVIGNMNSGTLLDEVTMGYEISADVTVSAKVDPSLMFTVEGVAGSTAVNGGTFTTSATSTFDTLPFGYLQTNTPKYLAHTMKVKTNAQNGYSVSMKVRKAMEGSYGAANNIDHFVGNGATWGAPKAWTSPTGTTASSDTGWLGAATSDTDVAGWGSAGVWGPAQYNTAQEVMKSSGPDLGTAAVTVSYALEVNVYQPSDSYSGNIVYACTPTY